MFRCCGAAAVDVEQKTTKPTSGISGNSMLLMSSPNRNANTAWLKVRDLCACAGRAIREGEGRTTRSVQPPHRAPCSRGSSHRVEADVVSDCAGQHG